MRITVLFWCLCLVPFAHAQDIVDCSEIESDEARLACYDDEFSRSDAGEVVPPSAVEDTVEVAAAPAAAPEPAVTVESAAEPVPAVTPAPKPVPAASGEQLFGKSDEAKNAAIAEAAGVENVSSITMAVTSVARDPHGKITIKLDNGQRWRQVRTERFDVSVGDEVVIKRAILGSFTLQRKSGGKKTKVRRVD